MNLNNRNLFLLYEEQALVSGERAFLSYKNVDYSYKWVLNEALLLAEDFHLDGYNLRVGIVIDKFNPYLYVSIVACWMLGHSIVPINKDDLKNNVDKAIQTARVTTILSDEDLGKIDHRIYHNGSYSKIRKYDRKQGIIVDPFVESSEPAYILFTSGSTGEPKAVPIRTESLLAYVKGVRERIPELKQVQILSNFFEPTFDLFFHDLLCAWVSGSTLVPLSRNKIFDIPNLVKKKKISVWFSVPSVIPILNSLGKETDDFESIAVSLFCGEALTTSYADTWLKLTSNQELHNLYGPTEATIAATSFKYKAQHQIDSIVKVGRPFIDVDYRILDDGELCLHGKQVFEGYLGRSDDALTRIDGQTYYKTGDLFYEDELQNLVFMGRKDRQVKILGNRVELDYVQATAREKNGIDNLFITPSTSSNDKLFDGVSIYYFSDKNQSISLASEFSHLPIKSTARISSVPLNKNGKVDYRKLAEVVMEG